MTAAQPAAWPNAERLSIVRHYGTDDLVARVDDALRQAGLGDGAIPWEALAPLDQFHVGGARATADLAARLAPTPGSSLLDVGCGLGGPSRLLAATFGCAVEGVDLNPSFVELATALTLRAGLSERVRHRVGDASRLSFEPESFDFAWTEHVGMNISDRRAFYVGVCAALRPGGRFAIYDVVAGDGEPLYYPAPWARDPADSFVISADATRLALEDSGFVVVDWRDATAAGIQWFDEQAAAGQARPEALRRLALPLVMGADFPKMAANLQRNLREGRARLLQAIVERPR